MLLVWSGLILLLLKWLEIGPVAAWSWLYILAPFGVAFIWFEYVEKMVGRDRRIVDDLEIDKQRRERLQKRFEEVRRGGSN